MLCLVFSNNVFFCENSRKLFCPFEAQNLLTVKRNFTQISLTRSPQDLEFNPNFAKIATFQWFTDTLKTFYSTLITCQIPAYNLYYIFQYPLTLFHVCFPPFPISRHCPLSTIHYPLSTVHYAWNRLVHSGPESFFPMVMQGIYRCPFRSICHF